MLTEICAYLRNYFDFNQPKFIGEFIISNGIISSVDIDLEIQDGQYYRVIGSVFNDGVWKYGTDVLKDETFNGAVWLMAIPAELIAIAAQIEEWLVKYGSANSQNMSPFTSESFAGYSYTKGQSATNAGGGTVPGWQSVYGSRLAHWKKL